MIKFRLKNIPLGFWLLVLANFFFIDQVHPSSLLVFYPTTRPVKIIEKSIKQTNDDISVYAKYKDFQSAYSTAMPKYVIATDLFGQIKKDEFKKAVTFLVEGKETYQYIAISLQEKWKKEKIENAKIGLVQIGEKKEIASYFSDLFGQSLGTIKTVSKPEDLFPMLVFNSVDIIILTPDNLKNLKDQFTAKYFEIMQSKEVSTPALYVKAGESDEIKNKFPNISPAEMNNIDFSGVVIK